MPRKPYLETAIVPVQLPAPPEQSTCASLIHSLVKHLLYARGHIPYLYDQLLQQTLDEQQQRFEEQEQEPIKSRARKRRLKKSDKQRLQLLHKTEALLDSLDPQKFSVSHPTRCFILFGASTAKPREAYELLVPAASTGGEEGASSTMDDYACRVLLRQLIISAPDLPEGSAAQRVGKVFVLLENTSGHGAPPGFLIKRNFKLSMKKGLHVKFVMGAAALQQSAQLHGSSKGAISSTDRVSAEAQPSDGIDAHTSSWLQSKFVLRGLRTNCDVM